MGHAGSASYQKASATRTLGVKLVRHPLLKIYIRLQGLGSRLISTIGMPYSCRVSGDLKPVITFIQIATLHLPHRLSVVDERRCICLCQ